MGYKPSSQLHAKAWVDNTLSVYHDCHDRLAEYSDSLGDGIKKAYKASANFVSDKIDLITVTGIPIGLAMALSDCDNLKDVGYILMGAGGAELIGMIKDRGRRKEKDQLLSEIKRLRREVKEVRKLEQEEVHLLGEALDLDDD